MNTQLKLLIFFWFLIVIFGTGSMFLYSLTPGKSSALERAPGSTKLLENTGNPTLLLFIHPQCSCSKATLKELVKLLEERGPLEVKIIFINPSNVENFLDGEIWNQAIRIPDVDVLVDTNHVEAKLFKVKTSGHAILFDESGKRVFSGGLTASRGHEGTSSGSEFIRSWLQNRSEKTFISKIFGCSFFKEE